MIIGKTFKFDAAHYLPGYKGPCSKLHGHTYQVTIEVEGGIDGSNMVMDLAYLKARVETDIISVLDHKCLNDFIEHPTCERIAEWIVYRLCRHEDFNEMLCKVIVQEGQGGYAKWVRRGVKNIL
jgi:6-pyruvoyltetrahydropterin/6-carboxytetrahydropterin synthase